MMPTRRGSLHLFRLFGVDVYLHWSWFLVALYKLHDSTHQYASFGWNLAEYLTLFLIVLMHEFGHALACRQVGGKADQIVLWPLGGVAYVAPPQRAGAMLWSIAAGPLVNVVLFPVFSVALLGAQWAGWPSTLPDPYTFILVIWYINAILLAFNLLPIYPLDGGQILRSLLWFGFGRARSLMIATIVGFVGIAALVPLIIKENFAWYYIMAAFVVMNLWRGFTQARILARVDSMPRRAGFACPNCKTAPPIGDYWGCGKCHKAFDPFLTRAVCPHCNTHYAASACLDCGSLRPIEEWEAAAAAPPQSRR